MCPKLIELLSWNGPTVHVCCSMLARAFTKTFVSRIHIRQPSPKKRKNLRQPKHFFSRVTLQPRYHCTFISTSLHYLQLTHTSHNTVSYTTTDKIHKFRYTQSQQYRNDITIQGACAMQRGRHYVYAIRPLQLHNVDYLRSTSYHTSELDSKFCDLP